MHRSIDPKILYFGTPVTIISTLNEDSSPNLAPMSSAWWLDKSCMLGMGSRSKTAGNLIREMECVINVPSSDLVDVVDRLALTTGTHPVPEYKIRKKYEHVKDKFGHAGLTPVASEIVRPPRVVECTAQLEAVVQRYHQFGEAEDFSIAFEVRVVRTHIEETILSSERRHYIDTDKWRPLIMSFCEYYELGANVHPSRLAKVY